MKEQCQGSNSVQLNQNHLWLKPGNYSLIFIKHFNFISFILAVVQGTWNLSYPIVAGVCVPGIGSMASQSLDHQGSPHSSN